MNEEQRFEVPNKIGLYAVLPDDHDGWKLIRLDWTGPRDLELDIRDRAYIKALIDIAQPSLYPLKTVTP